VPDESVNGDADGDGDVDADDLAAVAANWQLGGRWWAEGDFNGDTLVNIDDLSIIAESWQANASLSAALARLGLPDVAALPEPGLAIVLIALGLRRTKRRPGWRNTRCYSCTIASRGTSIPRTTAGRIWSE
jgi:hypothetical protein